MIGEGRVSLRWPVLIVLAALLIALGASGAYVVMRRGAHSGSNMTATTPAGDNRRGADAPAPPRSETGADSPLPDVVITLTEDAISRAGIVTAAVESRPMAAVLRVPAIVEPNAYKLASVTPLVTGRVARVLVELGARVRQGQTMATVFSPELAEAQTRYASVRAELDAHERELARTEKLVQIGAASKQELERVHAEHTAQRASVASARSRLELLGLSREAVEGLAAGKPVESNVHVPAPIAGVVTERLATTGVNVDPGVKLFTVVDLSTVWIVGNVYEQDLGRVRRGDRATIVTAAYPDTNVAGRVSYLDPQVSPDSRTAKVRVEVPNRHDELRLGMLAEMQIESASQSAGASIPLSAIQNVGTRSFVYISTPDAPTRFVEREVRVGESSSDRVQVLSGLVPGDRVVTRGAFFLRAERERLGLRPARPGSSPTTSSGSLPAGASVQTARITLGEQGYEPAKITLRPDMPARLTFLRTTDKTCGTEVAVPSLDIKRTLPLNQPVEIAFTPAKTGEIAFTCGMNMLKGVIVVE